MTNSNNSSWPSMWPRTPATARLIISETKPQAKSAHRSFRRNTAVKRRRIRLANRHKVRNWWGLRPQVTQTREVNRVITCVVRAKALAGTRLEKESFLPARPSTSQQQPLCRINNEIIWILVRNRRSPEMKQLQISIITVSQARVGLIWKLAFHKIVYRARP